MKHDARVFEVAAQLRLRNERNRNIHNFFTCCQQVCYYEELYCYGDLSFEIGCHQCYHNTVDNYKIKVQFLILHLFCNGFIARTLTLS